MNPILLRRRRTDRLFWGTLAVSLALHAVFVVVWIVGSKLSFEPPAKLPPNIIKTKLVKLGKKRDPNLLPRKAASPPPPTSKKAPEIAKKTEEAKPTKADAPKPKSASDILKDFEDKNATKPDLNSLIQDTIGEPLDEGDEQGSELGTEITGRMKANYNDVIFAKIKAKFQVPNTLTDQDKVRLKSVLFISIAADGRVTNASLSKRSGNSAFDNAVIAAAQKASPLPPPPVPLREFYSGGVGMNFCPISCS